MYAQHDKCADIPVSQAAKHTRQRCLRWQSLPDKHMFILTAMLSQQHSWRWALYSRTLLFAKLDMIAQRNTAAVGCLHAMCCGCRLWKMALGHVGLLHEVLGLLANMFPGCLEAQRAFCSAGSPALLQRCLDLVCKPTLDLPTLEVSRTSCCHHCSCIAPQRHSRDTWHKLWLSLCANLRC